MSEELNKGISPDIKKENSTDRKFRFSIQEMCLWLLVAILIGTGIGSFAMKEFYSYKIWSATNIQGIIYNGKIYDVLPSSKPFHP